MDLPHIGKPAPFFKSKAVLNDKVFDTSLSDYEKKYLILLFFPMNFTYVCPTELIAFNDRIKDFQELNTNILACSVESHLSHLKWLSMAHKEGGIRGLQFPLMADKSMAISKTYGILNAEDGVSYRAMFIIDDKGILRQITVNDHHVGRNVAEVCRLIKDIQHATILNEMTPSTSVSEVTTTNARKSRPMICLEKSSLREVIE
ncbi:hypothetical protein I4U23_008298 [Adineta vaga]|nr:hypothetical protein I4U23_008298 [Adineta vaga]